MDKTYKTIGLVLRRRDWRESDSLFDFSTRDFGKIRAVAIGSKKIKSKLNGSLSTPGILQLTLAKGRRVDRVVSAQIEKRIQIDPEMNWNYYNLLLEIIDGLTTEGVIDMVLWDLLNRTIKRLELANNNEEQKILLYGFTMKIMNHLGYRPELFCCSECGQKVMDAVFFSLANNGIVCATCQIEKFPIDKDLVKLAQIFLTEKLSESRLLILKKSLIDEVWHFLRLWLPYRLEKEIKSFKSIK